MENKEDLEAIGIIGTENCSRCKKSISTEEYIENGGYCSECMGYIESKKERITTNIEESDKDWLTILLLCLFTGVIGGHNFYVGKNGKGILYLFTFGCFGIGVIIDLICIITGTFTDVYGNIITNNQESKKTYSQTGQADEIKKYKDLLDSGIITQEEFDAKKKQLLGL